MTGQSERLIALRKGRGYRERVDFLKAFADEKINADTYKAHEAGKRPLTRAAEHYGRLLKANPAWLLFGTGPDPLNASQNERMQMDNVHVLGTHKGTPAKNGDKDQVNHTGRPTRIPLHASVPGPGKGWVMLSNSSSSVEDLAEMAGVPDPRGYVMPSDEMDPVIVNGEVLFPHPEKPAKSRSIVMIWLKKYPDEWFARELVRRDEDGRITVRKYGIDRGTGNVLTSETTIEWADVKEMTVAIRDR